MLRNEYLKRIKQMEEELYRDRSQYVRFLTKLAKLEGVGFRNSLQIWKEKPDATILKSYDEWKDLGRQVKYGEKGIAQLLGEKKNRRVGIKFDISQTYGEVKETNEILPKANINEVKEYLLDYLNQNCVSFQENIQLSPKHDFFVESLLVMVATKQGINYNPHKKDMETELSRSDFDKIGRTLNFFKTKAFAYVAEKVREREKVLHEKKNTEKEIDKEQVSLFEPESNPNDIWQIRLKASENEVLNAKKGLLNYEMGAKVIYQEHIRAITEKEKKKSEKTWYEVLKNGKAIYDGRFELGSQYLTIADEMEEFLGKEAIVGLIDMERKVLTEIKSGTKQEIVVKDRQEDEQEEAKKEAEHTFSDDKKQISLNRLQGKITGMTGTISPLTDEMFWEIQKEKDRQRVENYKIEEEVQPEKLTPSERLNNNIEAISMLKRLESGQRELDINAQDVLSKYVGWGGLAEVFDEGKGGQWEVARSFLKENLTEKEYNSARESTLTAFYTPKTVIDSIYQVLNDMGFRRGNILEPSMGIGNFIGNLPEEMKKSKFYGVEIDSISGRIAKQLYPKSKVEIKGLEYTNFSNNFFDIAIGNVPFGDFKVNDKAYDKHGFLIHDYFFAKALDKVRTGGIIAFITSSGTMDKENESVRKYLATRAELIGAIRLPNDTFKGVAGTEVTSDILFLKKRESVFEREEEWIHLATDRRGYTYNKYFVEHPEMVLGEMEEISGRFGKMLACIRDKEKPLKESLKVVATEIAKNARYEEIELLEGETIAIPATDDVKNYTYTIKEDTVYYRENSVFLKKEVTEKEKEKIKAYVEVREALKDVLKKQCENASDEEVEATQKKLREVHQKFSEAYQYINASTHRTLLREDSDYPLVSSIEVLDNEGNYVRQGDIFTKRTIQRAKAIENVETGKEALILSISEKGKVDFNYMSGLTGKNREELIQELKGEIFLNITSEITIRENEWPLANKTAKELAYVTKEEYLSGNIRDKIKQIDNCLRNYELRKKELSDLEQKEYFNSLDGEIKELEYQKNILIEALPKELTASEIRVKLGATWIPERDIQNFVYHVLKTPFYLKNSGITVNYSPKTAEWQIEGKSKDTGNAFAESNFGTSRVNAYKIIENMLNLRKTNIYDRVAGEDGKVRSVLNAKETMLAEGKQELIQMEFDKWIFADEERKNRLVTLYNERFNSVRNREYDGSNLSLEGINSEITLRPHQKDAIARCLFGGNTLLAHVVGAGKTFSMVASAMESKRLGMCRKSLFVVPKHLTGQIGREFMQLYPGANILVAEDDDFKKEKRKRFISKIATGDFDAIILGHTQFEKIPMSEEYQRKHIKEQIEEIVDFIEEKKYNFGQKFSVKQMEKTKKKLEARLEKLHNNSNKDDVITFEELGVDRLFVDEAHYYKNLYHHTKMQNVAGIGQTEAAKSTDLFMKCRYMDEITGGKGIVFATGTPVSNSMSELYTMQKYLQYETLKKTDFLHFDAWASTFAEVKTDTELAPEGSGYRSKTRFSRFDNLPELMTMFREIADIKMAEGLNLSIPEAKYEIIKTQPSKEQEAMLKTFSKRAEKVRNRTVDQAIDNMLKITGDGKKLALDQRLINPLLPDVPGNKINACVENIYQIWEDTEKQKATQLVFSDLGTPDQKKKKEFNIYDDIREKLVNRGIPRKEIAFIHEADTDQKKEELFAKVRKGEVRILLGSTPKMGAGTNVQDKLIALHDLDVPYRPSDLEQRRGRIVRQGNENKEVSVYRYITENTFDSYCWQIIENKQRFISQIMTSKTPIRTMEDIDEVTLSYAEIKALATGNPLIKEKMDLENQVTRLKMLQSNHKAQIYQLQDKISNYYPTEIRKLEHKIENVKQDIISRQPVESVEGEKVFSGIILGKDCFTDRKQAVEELMKEVKKAPVDNMKWIGSYRNFKLGIFYSSFSGKYMFTLKGKGEYTGELKNDDFWNIRRMDSSLDKMEERLERFQEKLKSNQMQLELAKEGVNTPFEQEEILKDKLLRLIEVNAELGKREEENGMEGLLQEAKEEILRFCHREYETVINIENFDKEFENLTHIGLAYTETPDEKHRIECVLNLKEYKATLLVDDIPVRIEEYRSEGESEESAIKAMIDDLKNRSFESFVEVNENELQEVMGLKIDEEGNYYEEKRITYDLER